MPLVINDRVKETSTTAGLGTYTLLGAVAGFQSFLSGIGDGNTTWYCATDDTDWEVGIGTYTASGTTLARTAVMTSSQANAAINWGAGTRKIFCTLPASSMPPYTADDTAPSNPIYGQKWVDVVNALSLTYFFDGNITNWVEFGPQGIPDMADLFKMLSADDSGGTNVLTAQPWFPSAGGVTVQGATTYFMRGHLSTTRAAGTTSHTTGLLFAGTATITSIDWVVLTNSGVDVITDSAAHFTEGVVATNTTIKAASTSATEGLMLWLWGIVRINATGTFIPQFIYSAAPGGTPTVKQNSFFSLVPMGTNAVTTQGLWA